MTSFQLVGLPFEPFSPLFALSDAELLARNVRRAREEKDPDLSQERLSDATRLHRTEIGRIEQASIEPRLTTLVILADALEVKIDDLVAGLPVPVERKPSPQAKQRRQ